MDKKRILLIGAGQCGNKLINLLLNKDKRYTGLFSNANLKDMEYLNNFDLTRNVFYIPNASGTGKSRQLAEKYITEEVQKLVDMILKFAMQDTFVIFTSADGGWGSGSLKRSVIAIKKTCPNKSINVVAVFPSLSEGEIAFRNTLEFWNDLIYLRNKDFIDSIQIIDNNKESTYDEINEKAIEELDYTLGFSGDTIDETDSKRINTAKGYKTILKLDDKYKNIDVAIDKAIKNSVFAQPFSYNCSYLGVSVKEKSFNANDFKSKFDSLEAPYCGYNEEENIVLLSGLAMPKESIELIQMALKDIENKKKDRVNIDDEMLILNDNADIKTKTIETKQKVKSTMTSKELNNMFNDNFWDD